jgi:hypothetical protein
VTTMMQVFTVILMANQIVMMMMRVIKVLPKNKHKASSHIHMCVCDAGS